jgi:hypothetical protein
MVLKKILYILLLELFCFNIFACDICGNYMGITPYDNKSTVSFLHRYRIFNGYKNYQTTSHFFPKSAYKTMHGSPGLDSINNPASVHSSKDFESFKIFELRLKYFVSKQIELNVFLPLLDNKSKTDTIYNHHLGFGDISLNAGYHLITPKSDRIVRHKFIIGLGIKLPTGNYYIHDNKSDRLPFEMQPGTGSLDGFAYINYVLMTKKIGASFNLNYKVNSRNKFHEKLDNSHNDFVSIFYKTSFKNLIIYPSIQANYEFTKGLLVKDKLQENTTINSLLLGPGIDFYYKSFSINTSWQFTVFEKIKSGFLESVGRISLGLNYSFVKKESN